MRPEPPRDSSAALRRALLRWYREERRDLPWRRTRDPYAIWVSEVMLQQTQVATVIGYFERWMARFPTIDALAAAQEGDVLRAWEGLGYYSRARALLAGARVVRDRHAGRLPGDVDALRELPGVGPYTAGAIASIAFSRNEPVVDGNVRRVLCRLLALRGDPTRAPLSPALWEHARALLPRGRAGEFNQALMELGARVCTPRGPACATCPVSTLCQANARGLTGKLPESRARPAVTAVEHAAAICARGECVLVVQVPSEAARWAGLWQFPTAELRADETPDAAAARAALELCGVHVTPERCLGVVRHSVTRYRVTLTALGCKLRRSAGSRGAGVWYPVARLGELAMPAPQRKLAGSLGKAASRRRTPGHRSG